MSVESLMVQPVTIQIPASETRDAIGGVEDTYDTVDTVMYLEPTTASEDMENRNTPIGDWIGFGKISDPFTSEVRIVYGPHTFDVIEGPEPMFNPRIGADSHYEMTLREVT